MGQVLDLRFDTLPSGYTPDSSRQVDLGGGPPGGLPAGTIGVWGIRPPLLSRELTLKRMLLPDPQVALDLDFSTVDRGYTVPPSSNVPLLFFKPYRPPFGGQAGLEFGTAYTPPAGNAVPLEFIRGGMPSGDTQYVFPAGLEAGDLGAPTVINWTSSIAPGGIPAGAVGSHAVTNWNSYIRPTGFSAGGLGSPSVKNFNQQAFPPGIAPGGLGRPQIENFNRTVVPTGIYLGGAGTPTVQNLRKYAAPTGFVATLFGTAYLSGGVREVKTSGFNAARYGTAFVAYDQRELKPGGIYQGAFGTPLIGFQRTLAPQGFEATYWGQTNVQDNSQRVYPVGRDMSALGVPGVDHNPRLVAPISIFSALEWGRAEVWNLRQVVVPYAEPGDWGERFGTFNYIENRNRVVGTFGHQSSRFGTPDVVNGARAVVAQGMDATLWGNPLVAFAIRHIQPPGLDSLVMSNWSAVVNAARVVAAAGADTSRFGQAQAVNTRRYLERIGNWESLVMGVPFVAFRVREVVQYQFPDPPYPGQPEVQNLRSYVDLDGKGIAPGLLGFHDAQVHRSIIAPRFNYIDMVGEPVVRNVTPEVAAYGHDSAEFGRAAAHNQWESYRFQGFDAALYGRPAVEYRTKTVFCNGIRAGAFGTPTCLWGDPNLPFTRTLGVSGIDASASFGIAKVGSNVIYPIGIDAFRAGNALVKANSIYPNGYFGQAFGTPLLNYPQTAAPESIQAGESFGKPVLNPLTIWAPFGAPQQAINNHGVRGHRIDAMYAKGGINSDDGDRPFFGAPRVMIPGTQYVAPFGLLAFRSNEAHWISLRRRTLLADGLKSLRMGFPALSKGGEAQAYGYDMSAFGTAFVSIYVDPTIPRMVNPAGLLALAFGAQVVQNQHRWIYPAGFLATRHGAYLVGPPKRADNVSMGVMTAWGGPFVAFRNRVVQPPGIAGWAVSEYTAGQFDQRIRVLHGAGATIVPGSAGDGECFGYPGVRNAQHIIRPIGCCSSGLRMGRPQVA
ncbi:TPA: hypothetical protein ACUUEJ_004201 [Pseudomonas aeruginosa]